MGIWSFIQGVSRPDLAARPRRCRCWRGFSSSAGSIRCGDDAPDDASFSASTRAMSSRSMSPAPGSSGRASAKLACSWHGAHQLRLVAAVGELHLLQSPFWSLSCARLGMEITHRLRAWDAAGMASRVAQRCFSAGLHTPSARRAPVVLKSVAHV